jgi:cyclic pyranopterin phosphate synthase
MPPVSLGLPSVDRRPDVAGAPELGERPESRFLIDSYGRRATDLRVSLTDRCNLRCTYCMPAEGLDWLPGPDVLTDAELIRLIGIATDRLGIDEVRFTGGEPLLRKGIVDIVGAIAQFPNRPQMSLTTNGLGLARKAEALASAGLDRVNISLDTLHRDRYTALTRRDRIADVFAALTAATAAGLTPVKINTVLMRGVNDDEAADLVAFGLRHGYQVRFIEQMPLDAGHGWDRGTMVTADEIQSALTERFRLSPHREPRAGAPAELFDVRDDDDELLGTVGIIGSVSRPFCGDCDRTRLTADGQMRTCLFSRTETDLRALLRGDADDEQIAEAWRTAMWGKLPGHGINDPSFLQPDRPMSAIGG